MSPSSKVNRRQWFAGIIATIAAILTPKPKLDLSRAAFQPAPGQAYATAHLEGGHTFYDIWPQPQEPVAFVMGADGELYQFGASGIERISFTLEMPRLGDEQVEEAFDEVNRMIDLWKVEPLFPRVEHHARIQS